MNKKQIWLKYTGLLCVIVASLGLLCFLAVKRFLSISYPELNVHEPVAEEYPAVDRPVEDDKNAEINPKPPIGEWFKITPEGTESSRGGEWHGLVRLGTENKVIVYFFGGGVAVDDFTAARPYDKSNGFYVADTKQDYVTKVGIAANSDSNPFKDWTILALPYSTGDFHIGNKTIEYEDAEGEKKSIAHKGYANYKAFMNEAKKYLDEPETLLITGYSAGGFASALLAEHVIENYFPKVENVTVHVDSALLLYDKWHEIAVKRWGAPATITKKLSSDNITLDSLKSLHEKHANVKILFDCSLRDGTLSAYQTYFTSGYKYAGSKEGDSFQNNLKEMVENLQKDNPKIGIYIWNSVLHKLKGNLSQHTVIASPQFYLEKFQGNPTMAKWIEDAVYGEINSYGLELLEENEEE